MTEQNTITYEQKCKYVNRKTPIKDIPRRIEALPILLRYGFGVEDIALRFDCTPELIRHQIEQMRASGSLDEIFGPKPTFRSIGELARKLAEGARK
jgi:hypothetical protein